MYGQIRKSVKTAASPPKSAAVASHFPVASSLPNSVLLSLQRYSSRAGAGIWPREKEAAGLADGIIQRKVIYSGAELDFEHSRNLLEGCCAPTPFMLSVLREMVGEEEEVPVESSIDLAKKIKQRAREKLGINPEEQRALDSYQGNGYKDLNVILRGGSVPQKFGQRETTERLMSALGKLPKPKGKVYRMVSFKTKEERNAFLDRFDGKEYATPQFDSTKSLAGGSVNIPEAPYKVQMVIDINETELGGDIASVISMFQDYEHEVLFPPGTKYQATKPIPKPGEPARDQQQVTIELKVTGQDEAVKNAALPTRADVRKALFGL